MNRRWVTILLPILVIAAGAAAAAAMILARPEPARRAPRERPPLVRVAEVQLDDHRLTVASQGTVQPRTESTLVPEVGGRVVEVSPRFVPGGFFDAGELLLRIDPADYRQAATGAEAEVARAELRLEQEQAEAEVARREWEELGSGGEPSPLTLRRPQVAEARASLAAARASLERARRDLRRTEIRAPYEGRVRAKRVDVGTYVSPGTALATVYAVDAAEVRLPIEDRDLAWLDLPLGAAGDDDGPPVILEARFGGETHRWPGHVVRTEGEIDPRTRMVHVVARVADPYGRRSGGAAGRAQPPLAVGLFVEAEIQGRRVEDAAEIPRAALRDDDRVLVVDEQERLRFRDVDVLRTTEDVALVAGGLRSGERVLLTPLAAVTEGMRVRLQDGDDGVDGDDAGGTGGAGRGEAGR